MNEYRRYHLTPVENARRILEDGFCEWHRTKHDAELTVIVYKNF